MNVVVARSWRPDRNGDVLYEEVVHNRYHGGITLGPYGFDWVFEIQTEVGTDRVKVPAGLSMTWEPML